MPIVTSTVLVSDSITPVSDGGLVEHDVINEIVGGVPPITTGRHVISAYVLYDGVPTAAIAVLTDEGRTNLTRIATEGLAFRVTHFQVGRGGYDPADPTQATTPNPALTTLEDPVWPSPTTYEEIDLEEFPNNEAVAFLCRLESDEALYGLGEIGLIATINNSPLTPAENGTQFLFAAAHVPMQANTENHVYGWRIIVAP